MTAMNATAPLASESVSPFASVQAPVFAVSASADISPADSNNTNGHTRGHPTDSAASKRAGTSRRNEDIA